MRNASSETYNVSATMSYSQAPTLPMLSAFSKRSFWRSSSRAVRYWSTAVAMRLASSSYCFEPMAFWR